MDFKQRNLPEIVESERLMVLSARERYPRFYPHAEEATLFLSNFLKSIDRGRFVFAMFLSQVKKHHTLALFSIVRLHQVQAKMDLRQVLEAGASAAYAIANPDHEHFVDADERGILDPSKELTRKRYTWLDNNYRDGSEKIKAMKGDINKLTAHANLVAADNNFRLNDSEGSFDAPFFDIEDEYIVKTDLWMVGNIAAGLMGLFSSVNEGRNVIKFVDDFESRLSKLAEDSGSLRDEMTQSERYKRTQEFLERAAPTDSTSSSRS